MPLHPRDYADILKRKVNEHGTQCWLVNTGWTGGPYGTGKRMPISITRDIIDKIHSGELASCGTFLHTYTGFTVPDCDSIEPEILHPEAGWSSEEEYSKKAKELMNLFQQQSLKIGVSR